MTLSISDGQEVLCKSGVHFPGVFSVHFKAFRPDTSYGGFEFTVSAIGENGEQYLYFDRAGKGSGTFVIRLSASMSECPGGADDLAFLRRVAPESVWLVVEQAGKQPVMMAAGAEEGVFAYLDCVWPDGYPAGETKVLVNVEDDITVDLTNECLIMVRVPTIWYRNGN
jgi:hypothetical protein